MPPQVFPCRGCATRGTDSDTAPSMHDLTISVTSVACGSSTLEGFAWTQARETALFAVLREYLLKATVRKHVFLERSAFNKCLVLDTVNNNTRQTKNRSGNQY